MITAHKRAVSLMKEGYFSALHVQVQVQKHRRADLKKQYEIELLFLAGWVRGLDDAWVALNNIWGWGGGGNNDSTAPMYSNRRLWPLSPGNSLTDGLQKYTNPAERIRPWLGLGTLVYVMAAETQMSANLLLRRSFIHHSKRFCLTGRVSISHVQA